eukprot:GHVH01010622.1.p1 GENE.GHVH01010622.1~~GHVH01010622.1.p1  ORF type:complete len:1133 (+),score=214.85 GHVH01010622.1:387-3785(+)
MKKKSSSTSSSSDSHEYYYVEDDVSIGKLGHIMADPDVVEIRRHGRDHTVYKEKKQKRRVSTSSSSSSHHTEHTGGGYICLKRCLLGWLLAAIFGGLFIGFLVAWLNQKDELDDLTTTTSPTTKNSHDFSGGGQWPANASVFNDRDQAVIDEEEQFVQNIVNKLTLEEKVAQMIQPALNQSDSDLNEGFKFGPGDQYAGAWGSMLNGGGGWPTAEMKYNNDGAEESGSGNYFACPGCNAHKSSPRAYARLMEEFHIMNEKYWSERSEVLGESIRIPWMYASDAVHGHNNVMGATLFPHNVGLGATRNADLLMSIGSCTAEEIAATGMDWTFAPAVSVPRFDTWGRTYEGYSEDPSVVYDFAAKMVEGIQGTPTELKTNTKVISNIKHFLGDGGTRYGIDRGDNRYTEEDLVNIHGVGYFSGLNSGAQVVMASFNSWTNTANYDPIPDNGVEYNMKIHGSEYLLTDVLKDRMGFDGIIVTDWLGHTEISGCTESSCNQLIIAGVDVVMLPGKKVFKEFAQSVIDAVEADIISEDRINDAVTRILRVKYRAGLWHKDSPLGIACHSPDDSGVCSSSCTFTADDSTGVTEGWEVDVSPDGTDCGRELAGVDETLGSGTHMEVARQAVRESLVLLKNNDSTLPINLVSGMTVGIIGSASQDWSKVNGGWSLSWQGGSTDGINTSIGEDSDYPNGVHITTAITEVVENAGGVVTDTCSPTTDYCILMIGEDPYAEMVGDVTRNQNMEYKSLKPSYAADSKLLEDTRNAADDTGMKVVTLFFSGRALYVNEEINNSDAFVVAWLPGSAGHGVTDVIFSGGDDFDFVGKLSRTWPMEKCQWNVNSTPEFVDDGWSTPFEVCYDDLGDSKVYPFGYGLDYASGYPGEGDLELDDRSYGCLSPNPDNVPAPSTIVTVADGTQMLCSNYSNQFDSAFMQIDCKCFSLSSQSAPTGCPVDPVNLMAVSVAAGRYSFESKASATDAMKGAQMFLKYDSSKDVSPWYFDTGVLALTVKRVVARPAPLTAALGLGMSFGNGSAAFEMSDRTMLDIGTVFDKLTLNTDVVLCIPLKCFNGDGNARNWFSLAQPLIVETRGTVKMELSAMQIFSDGLVSGGPTCATTVTDCTDTVLYPSYVSWQSRDD